jgi:hypothetical protein
MVHPLWPKILTRFLSLGKIRNKFFAVSNFKVGWDSYTLLPLTQCPGELIRNILKNIFNRKIPEKNKNAFGVTLTQS